MRRDWVAVVALLVPATLAPAQTGYTARQVVDGNAGGFTSFGSSWITAPAVNAVGQVSFIASTATSYGVYRGDGQSNTVIHSNSSSWSAYSGLSISTGGAVTYHYTPDTTNGWASIYQGAGGTAVVADGSQTGPYNGSLGFMPSSNAGGTVAFVGQTTADGYAVFAGTPGAVTMVARAGPTFTFVGSVGGLSFADDPSINAGGEVAFLANRADTGRSGVHVASGGGFATRVESGNGLDNFSAPVLNGLGTVAFGATRTGGGAGLYTVDAAGSRTTVAETGGGYTYFGDSFSGVGPTAPALNDAGKVAFLAGLAGGGKGIFTGPAPVADKVIAVGDALDGSTVADLGFGRYGLGDDGSVTAVVYLMDGRFGVYTFVPVPEPAAGLVVAVVGGMVWRRCRRARLSPPV